LGSAGLVFRRKVGEGVKRETEESKRAFSLLTSLFSLLSLFPYLTPLSLSLFQKFPFLSLSTFSFPRERERETNTQKKTQHSCVRIWKKVQLKLHFYA